jgi:hypothetical protein
VQETTGLDAFLASEVKVVDRTEWIKSNLDSFQRISEPLTERLENSGAFTREIGSRATGAQLGFVLGFVGSRVLGQFEIFTQDDPRLLLVAPNMVAIERQLDVVPRDFRLWVCVHEQTHRIQFASAPWLTGYLLENIHEYMRLSDMSTQELFARMSAAVRAVRSGDQQDGIIGAFHSGEQKVVFDRLTAVMSLLEGSRGRRHGRGRPEGHPHRAVHPRGVPAAACGGHQRMGGAVAPPARDGSQSASVRPGRDVRAGGARRRWHAAAQRGVGVARPPAHPCWRSRTRRCG